MTLPEDAMSESTNSPTHEDKTSEELSAYALAETDDDARWRLIGALHERGGMDEFQIASTSVPAKTHSAGSWGQTFSVNSAGQNARS